MSTRIKVCALAEVFQYFSVLQHIQFSIFPNVHGDILLLHTFGSLVMCYNFCPDDA